MVSIFNKTISGLKSEGIKYCGFLYAGIIIDKKQNIKVLEFNCRFGRNHRWIQ